MKVQRLTVTPPPRTERRDQNNNRRNNNINTRNNDPADDANKGSKYRKTNNDSDVDSSNSDRSSRNSGPKGGTGRGSGGSVADFGRDARRKRQPTGGRRPAGDKDGQQDDSRNRGKTSLRLGGSGRKARAASLSSRRGSLRKRDRNAEKVAKAEAAENRRTVWLPECVKLENVLTLMVYQK
jgi:hypothetical protein